MKVEKTFKNIVNWIKKIVPIVLTFLATVVYLAIDAGEEKISYNLK